jgi:hypothetical protein
MIKQIIASVMITASVCAFAQVKVVREQNLQPMPILKPTKNCFGRRLQFLYVQRD